MFTNLREIFKDLHELIQMLENNLSNFTFDGLLEKCELKFNNKIESMQNEIESNIVQISQYKEEIKIKNEELYKLETEISDCQKNNLNLQKQLEFTKSELVKSETNSERLKQDIQLFQTILNNTKNKKTENELKLIESLKTKENVINELNDEIGKLNSEMEMIKNEIIMKTEEIMKRDNKISKLKKEKKELHREFKELRKKSEHNIIVSSENFASPNLKSSPEEDFDHYMLNHNNHYLNPNNFGINEEDSNQSKNKLGNSLSNLESELLGEISKLDEENSSRKRSSILFNNDQVNSFMFFRNNSSKFKQSSLYPQISINHIRKSHKKKIGTGITISFLINKSRKDVDPLREYFILTVMAIIGSDPIIEKFTGNIDYNCIYDKYKKSYPEYYLWHDKIKEEFLSKIELIKSLNKQNV